MHRAASRVARLRQEITALREDPVYIERVLRRRLRELAPHRLPPVPPLPLAPPADAVEAVEVPDDAHHGA